MDPTDFIIQTVRSAVPDADVHPVDLGGGDHWFVAVVSATFEGQRPLARQRPILDAIAPHMNSGLVHAFDLKCITPQELQEKHGGNVPSPFHPHGDGLPGIHPRS